MERRLDIAPVAIADVLALERELGVSSRWRRCWCGAGSASPTAARAPGWRPAERHDAARFARDRRGRRADHGPRREPARGSPSTATTTSTASARPRSWSARCARSAPTSTGTCPAAIEDGYGLAAATVERLAARGTRLLVTVDCAITAVDEVAPARAAGMDVVVTDHHAPRATARCPTRPIVHPRVCGYPCPDLCAAGVAHKLAAGAAARPRGRTRRAPTTTSTSSRSRPSPTACRCAARTAGSCARACARSPRTRRPGLRALMRVAAVDPGELDARAVGFRLAPRINAAGRLYRADAGARAAAHRPTRRARAQIADELDHANAERRDVEQRILFEAEALVAERRRPGRLRAGRRGLAPRRDRHRRLAHRRAPSPPGRARRPRRRRRAPARAARSRPSTCSAG